MSSSHKQLKQCRQAVSTIRNLFPTTEIDLIEELVVDIGPERIDVIIDRLLSLTNEASNRHQSNDDQKSLDEISCNGASRPSNTPPSAIIINDSIVDNISNTDVDDQMNNLGSIISSHVAVGDNNNQMEMDDLELCTRHEIILAEMFPLFDPGRRSQIIRCLDGDFDQMVQFLLDLSHEDLHSFPDNVKTLSTLFPLCPLSVLSASLHDRHGCIESCITDMISGVEQSRQDNVAPLDMANHLKLQSLIRSFPTSDPETIQWIFSQQKYLLEPTKAALTEIFPPHHSSESSPPQSNGSSAPEIDSTFQMLFSPSIEKDLDALYRGERISHEPIDVLNAKVEALIAERHRRHQRSREAFNINQRVHGHILSEQAAQTSARLRQARERVMIVRFAHHNPSLQSMSHLDLHEMYVPEARRLLANCLARIRRKFPNQRRRLQVIVGIGRHSENTFTSKLGPAICQYLSYIQMDYTTSQGSIIVYIT